MIYIMSKSVTLNYLYMNTMNFDITSNLLILHSYQEDWFRHDRLSILNVICMSTLSI